MDKVAVLFDLDGTLVDSLPDICETINEIRAQKGFARWDNPAIRVYIGRGADYLIGNTFPELPASQVPTLLEEYRAMYLQHPHRGGSLYPGVRETLEALRAHSHVRLGVATNKPSVTADRTLEFYMPGFKFDVVLGPERVSRRKPDPAHLLETLEKLDVSASRAWFVGDDPVDAECARRAKVRFLAAAYGFGGVQGEDSERLLTFSDLLSKVKL